MARFRLMSDPASDAVAIFKVLDGDPSDDAPLASPYGNLDRLQIHSGLIYPSTSPDDTQSVAVTIPAQAANTKYSGQINLFAHGKGEPCMVEGVIKGIGAGGSDVGFNGTMPVDVHATGHATWLALGATNTHVVLLYFGITYQARAALDLTIEASAYDFLASGPAPTGEAGTHLLENEPESFVTVPVLGEIRVKPRFRMGRRRVDSYRRYIRKVDGGADFAIATGPTLSIIGLGLTTNGSYVQNEVGWRWRYSCAGYVQQTTVAWNGTATNGGTYDAPYILVKR